ncbi:hypothetical protein MKW94_000101 [Papaver nudicaule]|uniref:DNA topoisomerase (ATP-hydrolyzing) n=1 Tax=Papaver nudicaule TaxID=74823 RepID=A0AA42B014_PAPNU|nr:hypothetical protein [Papaver nudicaule]
MHLFDPKGAVKKYDNPEQILEDFYGIRLELYKKRKRVLLENLKNLELELKKLDNKVRFILGVVKKEIKVCKRNLVELLLELHQKGFDAFPKNTINGESSKPEDNSELLGNIGVQASDYDYLLSLGVVSLTNEKVQELCNEKEKLEDEVEELKSATERSLWMKDLESLEKKLDEQDMIDSKAEEAGKLIKSILMKNVGMNAAKQAPKIPRKYTKKASTTVAKAAPASSSIKIDKPKGKGRPGKAPVKKVISDINSDDKYEESSDEELEPASEVPSGQKRKAPAKSAAVPSGRKR